MDMRRRNGRKTGTRGPNAQLFAFYRPGRELVRCFRGFVACVLSTSSCLPTMRPDRDELHPTKLKPDSRYNASNQQNANDHYRS